MDIQFYHLLTTPLEVALPKLAATAYGRDIRVCIVADESQLSILDKALWTYDPNSFIPHAVQGKQDEAQPILLTPEPSIVNNPSLLMITNGTQINDDMAYERVFDIFNGNDDAATQAARQRWSAYKESGYGLTYIKQQGHGGWEKVMEVNKDES